MSKSARDTILLLLCFFILNSQIILPEHAGAADLSPEEAKVDAITTDILRKEIDLERYYLQYRVHGTKEPKYRRARYFALQVSAGLTGLASNLVALSLTGGHIKNPESISLSTSRQGFKLGLIGTVIDGGSSALELGSNTFTAIKNIKQGKSPAAAVRNVEGRLKEIDKLLAERDKLLREHPELNSNHIFESEGRVLKSFRDWCLSEFADVYADVKSSQASANVYYILDIASDCAYLASLLLSMRSLKKPELSDHAVNTAIVGDSIGIVSAPASAKSYNMFYRYHKKKLAKRLQEDLDVAEEETKQAMADLNKELASKDIHIIESAGRVQNRIEVYLLWSARYDKYIDKGLEDQRHQSKVALQGVISGPAIYGMYLNEDILAKIALKKFADRPKAQNNLYMAGSIGTTVGTAASLALTNYWLFDQLRYQRKMRKKGMLPEQLLAERLKTLDELDERLQQTE